VNRTQIEWILNPDGSRPGWSWNPITGCLNGCEYCYARRLANGRLRERYLANTRIARPIPDDASRRYRHLIDLYDDPFYPRFWPERLSFIATKPRGVLVCDMSDLFGIGIPEVWMAQVMLEILIHPRDRFYLLTKQPQRLPRWSPFPDNCWVGVSATDTLMLINATKYLAGIEAKVKYISIEPFLAWDGWQDFTERLLRHGGINQVIIGAQIKPLRLPERMWVDEILKASHEAGVSVFMKNSLRPLYGDSLIQEMPKQ